MTDLREAEQGFVEWLHGVAQADQMIKGTGNHHN